MDYTENAAVLATRFRVTIGTARVGPSVPSVPSVVDETDEAILESLGQGHQGQGLATSEVAERGSA